MPRGLSNGYAPTRQLARRRDSRDAVDWPDFTLNGRPLFRAGAEERRALRLRIGREAAPLFQLGSDDVIQPGGHWLRAIEARGARRHLYTADKTARSAPGGETGSAAYELWTFPILIKGEGGPVVKNVELWSSGQLFYKKGGPWRSLTLLVPASAPGQPYELRIDGRPAVRFEAGLMPVKLGDPRERLFPLHTPLAGDGPKISVTALTRPEEFPNKKEWDADVAALAQPITRAPRSESTPKLLRRHLGAGVPHSPFTLYAAALPHGMRGGFFQKEMPVEEYAQLVAETGYDAIFESVASLAAPAAPDSHEQRAAALGRRGVRLGLMFDNNWARPSLQHPNVAFLAHTLPEWHAPLYRSLSLAAQRFTRLPNFAGLQIGADNGGYISYGHRAPAPPTPERPWAEGMIEFMGTPQPEIPRAAGLGPREHAFEVVAKNAEEFTKYVGRYDLTFQQYGYFAEAVREVDPQLAFTTASFGSSPGAGARGGWPWASLPGRVIFQGLTTQQAYDWNEKHAAKPMHNAALTDRLRSYFPQKKTWSLVDDFRFLHGREAWQRTCAIALTRGIQGLGTNFLAHAAGDRARPDVVAWRRELHGWIRKYGGVYARSEPAAAIGIVYSHHQAVLRRVLPSANVSDEKLHAASHEGKVTEALFLCHAAGWPARVITYQELMRGPLPSSMKAILLVGLEPPDESWQWGPGLDAPLKTFTDRGGRVLADAESSCPAPFTRTALRVAAYVPHGDFDPTPLLLARNAGNIRALREAMRDVPPPMAASDSETLWAIPTQCADTQYVTVVNQAFAEGDEAKELLLPADPRATKPEVWKLKGNASRFAKPQTGALRWNTERPIYDVRLGRKVTLEEAAPVDLTADAFRWYALPPAEVVAPEIKVDKGVAGFYEAKVAMHNGVAMGGIPVQLTVTHARGSDDYADWAIVFSSTGAVARLPLHEDDGPGVYRVTATELLSGLTRGMDVELPAALRPPATGVRLREAAVLAKFAARKHVALTIALTPAQEKDAQVVAQATALAEFYRNRGRIVARSLGKVQAGGIVESLQPLKSPHRWPQWKTIASDLVLFGTPADNVLLLDQARGEILPTDLAAPAPGEAEVIYTRSPFVGEYDAVNIIASDAAGIAAAVKALTGAR